MEKSNKELAVELAGQYIRGIYSAGDVKPLTPEALSQILKVFYDTIKKLPDD